MYVCMYVCSSKTYVVRMLKLLVAHFTATAILVCCATTLAASTRPFLRNRYRFRRSILTNVSNKFWVLYTNCNCFEGTEEDIC